MKRLSEKLILILFVVFMVFSASGFGENTIKPGLGEVEIKISAGKYDFSGGSNKVVFSKGVKILYDDMMIEAPTITAFYSSLDTVDYFIADSSDSTPVILHKDKEVFTTKSLKAYVQKKAFFLYELRGTYKAKNAKGKTQNLVLASEKSRSKTFDGKSITEAHQGYLTTCDEERPHYRFQANYIVVKESNEVIAYDLMMYIYDIPVLPYPVMFTSLERTAQPVESSFTFTGNSGIQTHLRFNYYSKGDEIGAIFFDTVGDGEKKGNTIGAENKFTLPDGKTKIYFYGLQKTGEEFSNRNSELKFDLARNWTDTFDTLFYYRNKQDVKADEIKNRTTETGITLKGKINGSAFNFAMSEKEIRNEAKKIYTNTYVLPSFSIGKMSFKYFEDVYPIGVTFSPLKFNANTTTDASATFMEVLESLKYSGQYGVSTALPKVIIRDVDLMDSFNTTLQYSFKQEDDYKDDLYVDNTFGLPKFGFGWEDYFGLYTQYTMRVGYLDDAAKKTAYRYSENVKTDLNFRIWIWENQISHDYVFLRSEGNTSRFKYNKEKNLLSLASSLNFEPIGSKITLKTSYDFLKETEQLSNPLLLTTTDMEIFDTSIKFNTKSTIDASSTKFLSTDYAFKVNHKYFSNNLAFIYFYDQDISVKKLVDSFGFNFGPLGNLKTAGSNFDMTFLHDEEKDSLELDKLMIKNKVVFSELGKIKTLTENFDIQISPKEEEDKINYIKNTLDMKFEDMNLIFVTKYSKKKTLDLDFSGTFDDVKVNIGALYYYEKRKINFDFGGTFEGLKINYGTLYDMENNKVESIKLAMVKDLHCWLNETSMEFGLNEDLSLELKKFTTSFSIKAFPEKHIKVEPLKKEFDLAVF